MTDDDPKPRGWSLRILRNPPANLAAPTMAELAAAIDLTPHLAAAEPPWPVVGECFSSHLPEHACAQCDGSHDHEWVARKNPPPIAFGGTRFLPAIPVRCKICGARKCDRPACMLRRHHGEPHEDY